MKSVIFSLLFGVVVWAGSAGASDGARFKSLNDFDATGVKLVGIDGDISVDLALRRFHKDDGAIIDPGVAQEFNKTNLLGLKPDAAQIVAKYNLPPDTIYLPAKPYTTE